MKSVKLIKSTIYDKDGKPIDSGIVKTGSGTGTGDYNDLTNKPKINGVELIGNKTNEELNINIPTKLPNPNSITFTGGATGSYDGSSSVTIDIPQGGTGGPLQPLTFTGAVSAEYDGTQPVTVEIPAGGGGDKWEYIGETVVPDGVATDFFSMTEDFNGKEIKLKEVYAIVYGKNPAGFSDINANKINMGFSKSVYTNGLGLWSKGNIHTYIGNKDFTVSTVCALVANDRRILSTNLTIPYNDSSVRFSQGYANGLNAGFEVYGSTHQEILPEGQDYIDSVSIGSYQKNIGEETKIIVYGVRA